MQTGRSFGTQLGTLFEALDRNEWTSLPQLPLFSIETSLFLFGLKSIILMRGKQDRRAEFQKVGNS